jgi:hypothetical protein
MIDPNKQNFCVQRWHAGRRGVEWNLTFEEWLQIWNDSGKLHLRGRGKGKYCMARFNDVGPYALGNVYITTNEKNNTDQVFNGHTALGHHPVTLIHENGDVKYFFSKSQAAKFFKRSSNQLPDALRDNRSYKGWKHA